MQYDRGPTWQRWLVPIVAALVAAAIIVGMGYASGDSPADTWHKTPGTILLLGIMFWFGLFIGGHHFLDNRRARRSPPLR